MVYISLNNFESLIILEDEDMNIIFRYKFLLLQITNRIFAPIIKMSVDWPQSRMHALNNSTSKPTYGFPKSPRFSGSLRPLCDTFYNVTKSLQTGKGASIGKGNKTSFGDKYGFPSPLQYQIRSSFEGNCKNNKGVKLGLGRQNIKYGGIFSKSQTPDPSHYNIKDPRVSSPRSGYTLRPKLKEQQFTNQKNPGPGQYNTISTISATGIYNLSNIANCACPKIKPSKPYDSRGKQKTPGPGQYNNEKQTMNETGKYFISKYSDSRCRSFSKSSHKDQSFQIKAKLPGPGAYNYYSEFGARTKIL